MAEQWADVRLDRVCRSDLGERGRMRVGMSGAQAEFAVEASVVMLRVSCRPLSVVVL